MDSTWVAFFPEILAEAERTYWSRAQSLLLPEEGQGLKAAVLGVVAFGLLSFLGQQFLRAPWGKFSGTYGTYGFFFGPEIPHYIAWTVQEIPSFLLSFSGLVAVAPTMYTRLLLGIFALHYFLRSVVYPLRARRVIDWKDAAAAATAGKKGRRGGKGRTIPLLLFLMAAIFNVVNASMQVISIAYLSTFDNEQRILETFGSPAFAADPARHLSSLLNGSDMFLPGDFLCVVRLLSGLLLFAYGMKINISCDYYLMSLKASCREYSMDGGGVGSSSTSGGGKGAAGGEATTHSDAVVEPSSRRLYSSSSSGRSTSDSATTSSDASSSSSAGALLAGSLRSRAGNEEKNSQGGFDDGPVGTAHDDSGDNNTPSYKIPRGGWFEFVSCANYFGEMVEWIGFAIICGTAPSWAFAAFTVFFLSGRALNQHQWYCDVFGRSYPPDRKAVIPCLL